MNLSISNIAWETEKNEQIYMMMQRYGYMGLEIAPTKVFPSKPYSNWKTARFWTEELKKKYGISISSMQSIWYGKKENIFENKEQRNTLLEYTKKAIDFANIIGCKNVVFGCPQNRAIKGKVTERDAYRIAGAFFRELSVYAYEKQTIIGMEANPSIYNTDFINTTKDALRFIKQVDSDGFKLNLDVGTMIQNGEDADELIGNVHLINHVHISEPGLKTIEKRGVHKKIKSILELENYMGFVSIEMGKNDDLSVIERTLKYVKETFS